MTEPVVAQKSPIAVDVAEGKSYWWCACGKSSKQPFCDGSHKGSEFAPVKYDAETTKKVFFCACKKTGKSPLCDGTHNRL
jgi:CDGSH-type Zn-finger protein